MLKCDYKKFCSDWKETNIFIKCLAIMALLNVNKTKYRVTFFQFFADYMRKTKLGIFGCTTRTPHLTCLNSTILIWGTQLVTISTYNPKKISNLKI